MTDLQKTEFDMLKIFTEICEKLNINYYLVCGSALGAAKYKGFIPWDDDLDVGLLRPDYEIFIREAEKYLPEHIFLQNYHTDKNFTGIFSKLRNSQTTYIEKSVSNRDINHGVYIDVFPLDGYPTNKKSISRLERQKTIFSLMLACVYGMPDASLKTRLFMTMERAVGLHKKANSIVNKLDKLLSAYPIEGSDLICNHGNWQGKLEYAPKEQYGKGMPATFEDLSVRIPEKYDEYLTQKYGNWRADLPDDQKVGHHYYAVCDLTRSYTEYIERLPNGKIRIKSKEEVEKTSKQ